MLALFLTLIDDENDREKFTLIYEQNKQAMFFCAMRILDDEMLAEDAVQEAFLRAAVNISRITPESSRPLMLTIVRNTALTIRKKNSREMPSPDPGIYLRGSVYTDDGFDSSAVQDNLVRRLGEMPRIYSEVFVLRYARELPYSRIASLLGISVPAAKKRAQRAREMLRKSLEDLPDE